MVDNIVDVVVLFVDVVFVFVVVELKHLKIYIVLDYNIFVLIYKLISQVLLLI